MIKSTGPEEREIGRTDGTWHPILDFPGYLVDKLGNVKSLKTGKILKPILHKSGHLYVFLYRNNKGCKKYIHQLILETFVGYRPDGMECRHLDGNPQNNSLENLKWGTSLQNAADKQKHGTQPKGEKTGTSKLTESQVLEIRAKYKTKSLRALALEYGVSHTVVRRAALSITWKHI